MRRWLALLFAAGCYQPTPTLNAPCGPNGECPSGLACRAGVCTSGGGAFDDAPIQPGDSAPPLIDAPADAPNVSGCADGEREAFPSLTTHPTIAGCGATWDNALDLRAARTTTPCGDDLGKCDAPVDACQVGWHVCGTAGDPVELSGRATEADCADAGGVAGAVYVTAMSHCTGFCTYDLPLPCAPSPECSEPVCCGAGCRGDQGCVATVYPATKIAGAITNGCGNLLGSSMTGVLCCQ